MPCEEILHNNDKGNNIDNKRDNVLSTLSIKEFIEILYPIFFFKNNCNPKPEIERFVKFYKDKGWKLGGGQIMTKKEEIVKAAESWQVKEKQETGFHPYFIKAWKEIYKKAPESLKKEFLEIKTPSRGPSSSTLICSQVVKDWLDENKELVRLIFMSHATDNYSLVWKAR